MKPVVVLGATGSIGRQTLDVVEDLGVDVAAVAAGRGSGELLDIAGRWPGARVGVATPTEEERALCSAALGDRVIFGNEAMVELAAMPGTTVVNGIVGSAGLGASVSALAAGNRLGLANKESLVVGGEVVKGALARGGGELIPIDSEHSALFQCLLGEDAASVRRLVLPASGGPFRGMAPERLETVTVAEALAHPTWKDMGTRITVDSATLMNKGFEVIEAHHLFGFAFDAIDIVIHPQSIVHGIVEFVDGSLKAHLGEPDMRVPIRYALTHPARRPGTAAPFPFAGTTLTFEAADSEVFPCIRLAYDAGRAGGSAPTILNAADEIAVQAFLDGRIGFTSIAVVIERTLADMEVEAVGSVEDVMAVDRAARAVAAEHLGGAC
ncbi:MAG: 1-deoxy-D-xylulose-5-phosphate reductoisomerase [Actinobacteria bacterium RBG_16_68_21]|nr:MAG: 1-deoxy-D-xylulose-5-phosphate reductoisomerase [Actinobacteria bacterium RBG_16_68_21]